MGEASKCRSRVLKYCVGKGLDIGCGDDKICPDAIGVDRRIVPGVTCLVHSADKLEFHDETMDYVFSSHCLEDLFDRRKGLREWLRILKPGGYLILYLPDKEWYPNVGHPLANKAHIVDVTPELIMGDLDSTGVEYDLISSNRYGPPNGVYVWEDRGRIEYSFEIVIQKK